MYRAGIVGLPNVGKSTLFNALINNYQAEASNYPFCTIEPNVGIVNLPDERLLKLSEITKINKIIPACFEFIDIAGLVKGASKGEGLGNQFLSHIREVDAIVHVVRCFEDPNIAHIENSVNPVRDIETINIELVLSDLQQIERKITVVSKKAKGNDKVSKQGFATLEKVQKILNEGKSLQALTFENEETQFYKSLFLLSDKPIIYACNVLEHDLKNINENILYKQVKNHVREKGFKCVPVCAKLEEDLINFSQEEKKDLGGGIEVLIKETFDLLDLATFFTITGDKEVRAWTFKKDTKAFEAAGIIHSDFQKGFIKAEIIKYADLIKSGSKIKAREAGLAHLEGKDYIVQDGDIIEFKFNVSS